MSLLLKKRTVLKTKLCPEEPCDLLKVVDVKTVLHRILHVVLVDKQEEGSVWNVKDSALALEMRDNTPYDVCHGFLAGWKRVDTIAGGSFCDCEDHVEKVWGA